MYSIKLVTKQIVMSLTMSSIASLRAVNVSTTNKGTAVVTGVKEDM
jgi:hypothetical protein